jgi:hypothetical protein
MGARKRPVALVAEKSQLKSSAGKKVISLRESRAKLGTRNQIRVVKCTTESD